MATGIIRACVIKETRFICSVLPVIFSHPLKIANLIINSYVE